MSQKENIKVEVTRNKKARLGEGWGTLIVIISLFAFIFKVWLGAILLVIGLVIFLYGRFNE